jgi:hypothetical protein
LSSVPQKRRESGRNGKRARRSERRATHFKHIIPEGETPGAQGARNKALNAGKEVKPREVEKT